MGGECWQTGLSPAKISNWVSIQTALSVGRWQPVWERIRRTCHPVTLFICHTMIFNDCIPPFPLVSSITSIRLGDCSPPYNVCYAQILIWQKRRSQKDPDRRNSSLSRPSLSSWLMITNTWHRAVCQTQSANQPGPGLVTDGSVSVDSPSVQGLTYCRYCWAVWLFLVSAGFVLRAWL